MSKPDKKMLNQFVRMKCKLTIGEAIFETDNLVKMFDLIHQILSDWSPPRHLDKTTKERKMDPDNSKYTVERGETYRNGKY